MLKNIFVVSTFVVAFADFGMAQIKIIGTITSATDNKKISNVTVKLKNNNIQTLTDSAGNFEINVPNYDAELEIIKDGIIQQTIPVNTNDISLLLDNKTFYLNYLNYLDYNNYNNYYNYGDYSNYSNYYNYYNYYDYYNYYNTAVDDVKTTELPGSKDEMSYSNYSNYYNYYYTDYSNSATYLSDYSNYYNAATETKSAVVADIVTSEGETSSYKKEKIKDKNDEVESGLLTAGEINDFTKWDLWNDITKTELSEYQKAWYFYPTNRYCVQILSETETPIINAEVILFDNNQEIVWTAKTDNTGKAELWGDLYRESLNSETKYRITVKYQDQEFYLKYPKKFQDGINFLTIDAKCEIPNKIDIAFVVDATGSMGDEIKYLQAELLDILNKINDNHKDLKIRTSSVFYRDIGDDYVTIKSEFSENPQTTVDFIALQEASGGGDFPEAVDDALRVAINDLNWEEDAMAKVLFIVLDAPPHQEPNVIEQLQKQIIIAAQKGIRIIPITCSGIDKTTEYLMRSMALATNGTYVFLTDDSGIGNSHLKPSTDTYEVETLNDIIIRLINQYSLTPDCNNVIIYDKNEIDQPDKNDKKNKNKLKFYPNPTTGVLKIDITEPQKILFLTDFSGKILAKYDVEELDNYEINIENYPAGIYFVQYLIDNALKVEKIILIK